MLGTQMHKLQQLAQGYLNLIFQHTGMLPISLGIIGVLYGIGFLVGDMYVNTNYYALYLLLPKAAWGILVIGYSLIKLASPVCGAPTELKIFNSLAGLWFWNYTVFSFIILDTSPIAPAELILLAPLLFEVIDLALQIWEYKFCRRQR